MTEQDSKLFEEIKRDHSYIVELRRDFHRHPEIAKEEFRTAERIEEELDKIGLAHKRVGETGVYAEIIGGMTRPRVGILNIGEEETKGREALQRLNKILTEHIDELPYEYIGFVEGNDITSGKVQVVVTDGFTGNVMLKTVEGTAKMISRIVKANYKRSLIAILTYIIL